MEKNNWAIEKGMQMAQGLNDEASKASQESTSKNDNEKMKRKRNKHTGVECNHKEKHTHMSNCIKTGMPLKNQNMMK